MKQALSYTGVAKLLTPGRTSSPGSPVADQARHMCDKKNNDKDISEARSN